MTTRPGRPWHKANAPPLADGTRVGRYELVEPIGAGGMGVVYLAKDPVLGRRAAVKLLRPDHARESQGVARMLREAQALARLAHPNVVSIFEVGIVDGDAAKREPQVYIAMELVDGSSLRQWLRDERPSWPEIVRMFAGAGRGLAAAHDAGLVHRDFKPANVLVGSDRRARVVDFGLARRGGDAPGAPQDGEPASLLRSEELTATGSVIGTPAYMAPEQHRGTACDAYADQFAFCVSLYEALYGLRPFRGRGLVRAKIDGEPVPRLDREVPGWLHRAITRGLSPRPSDRWPSMTCLVKALESGASRSGRRVAAAISGVAGVALLGWAWLSAAESACTRAHLRLAGVWDDTRRANVRSAFEALNQPLAATTAERVDFELHGYARRWVDAYGEACEAELDRRTSSAGAFDVRMRCLDDRRRQLAALVDVLEVGDAQVVPNAVAAVSRLPDVRPCADENYVRSHEPGPDQASRESVEAVRVELARGRALRQAGQHAQALEVARSVATRASELGYPSLTAEAGHSLGRALVAAQEPTTGRDQLREAFFLAASSGADAIAARVAIDLAQVHGREPVWLGEAPEWIAHASAIVDRLDDDALRADLWSAQGIVALERGEIEQAVRHHDRALTLRQEMLGPDHVDVAASLNDLAMAERRTGRFEEAAEHYRKTLAIEQKVLGPDHPEVAKTRNNIGNLLLTMGDAEGARTEHEAALALRERVFGPVHGAVAMSLGNLALALNKLQRYDTALAHLQRALAIRQALVGPDHPLIAATLDHLALVYYAKSAVATSVELTGRALELRERHLGRDHPDVATSLVNHGTDLVFLGREREALEQFLRAEAIFRDKQAPDHPNVGIAQYGAATAYCKMSDYRNCKDYSERSVAVLEAKFGPDNPDVAHPLTSLGEAQIGLGESAAAVVVLERALALREGGDSAGRSETQYRLGQAIDASSTDRQRARALVKAALEARTGPQGAQVRRQMRQWLASHPPE